MKNVIKVLSMIAVVGLLVTNVGAQEKKKGDKKKGGDPAKTIVTTFMKNLEPVGLSDEQKTKIEAIISKAATDAVAKRNDAGISNSMTQKSTKATKEERDAGKKGADLKKAVAEKLGLTDAQIKTLDETNAIIAKAKVEAGKLLTEEQMGKLKEDQFKASLKEKGKGKGKKKKAA